MWHETIAEQQRESATASLVVLLPWIRFLHSDSWGRMLKTVAFQRQYIKDEYLRAASAFSPDSKPDSFIGAMIAAKREAESEANWMTPFLKQDNLLNVVSDLFLAGTGTLVWSLRWILLFMSRYPQLQERMRAQADGASLSADSSVQRSECPLISAFIHECLRLRPPAPLGIAHKALVDEEIGGHRVPAGTAVIVLLTEVLSGKREWQDPESFRPERFLDPDGGFVPKPNRFFVPFSDGRRSCPGERLALHTLFLVVAHLLRRTTSIQVEGGVTEEHMRGDPTKAGGLAPPPYFLRLSLRSCADKE